MNIKLIITLVFLFTGSITHATVTVSNVTGTISNGSTVTISGSGFGLHTQQTPAIWDNCESGTVASKWDAAQPTEASDTAYNMQYRTAPYRNVSHPDTHGTRFAVGGHHLGGYTSWNAWAGPNVMLTTTLPSYAQNSAYYYASWYVALDPLWPTSNDNFKWFRITTVADGTGCDDGGYYLETRPLMSGTMTNGGFHANYVDPNVYGSDDGYRGADPRQWLKFEVYGYIHNTDGWLKVYENGSLKYNNYAMSFTMGTNYQHVVFGEYWQKTSSSSAGGDENAFRYFTDLYFDNTLQHVMVGNADTLEGCTTLREIQPYTAWSDTSITITFNQGGFVDSATAYLYVFDSTGEANATGYEVTIGEGSSPSTPSFTGVMTGIRR